MTNSSVAKKPQGPLRLGAIVPITVLVILVGGYFHLFFDGNVRRLMEWTLTKINGAEVNVGYVNTSFIRGSFEFGGIQVTDKNQPERNVVQIGRIHFQFMWDALLRAKFVVDDASIDNIQALAPRKHPGYVVPPEPPSPKGPSVVTQVQDSVVTQAKSQYNDNMMGDLASVLGGTDLKDQLKNIEGELKSSARIKELDAELKEKQKAWQEKIKTLPQGKEIQELADKFKGLKFDSKNPLEFAKSVQEADKLIKEADKKIKLVSETSRELNKDIDTYSTAFKDLEKMVDQDLKDIQTRLKIPDINSSDFSKSLFMGLLEKKLGGVLKYLAVAQHYMPPKKVAAAATKKNQEPDLVPPKRGQGKTYRFPITTGYPLFWLKHAGISSKATPENEYSGNMKGEIKDVTSDPDFLGKPTLITFDGDFPKQQIKGLAVKAVLDHTTDVAKDTVNIKVASYPVGEQKLSDSNDVKFVINNSTGGLDLTAGLTGNQIELKMMNAFTEMKFDIDAKNSMIKEVLQKVMADIPVITVNAGASGALDKMKFELNSNLGDELSKGFKAQIQAKIDEAKGKLKTLIDEKILPEKQKLTAEFDKIKAQVTGDTSKIQKEIETTKQSGQAQADKGQKQGGTKKLEEEGKKLLKKFGIGG